MAAVRTDGGSLAASGPIGSNGVPFTPDEAEADAADRNARAAELGIKTRYVVADK